MVNKKSLASPAARQAGEEIAAIDQTGMSVGEYVEALTSVLSAHLDGFTPEELDSLTDRLAIMKWESKKALSSRGIPECVNEPNKPN